MDWRRPYSPPVWTTPPSSATPSGTTLSYPISTLRLYGYWVHSPRFEKRTLIPLYTIPSNEFVPRLSTILVCLKRFMVNPKFADGTLKPFTVILM